MSTPFSQVFAITLLMKTVYGFFDIVKYNLFTVKSNTHKYVSEMSPQIAFFVSTNRNDSY